MKERKFYIKILLIFVFGAAFGYMEAAVVVYLRDIYYPQGFHFPIKHIIDKNMYIEVIREFSTLMIMASISTVLSKKFWEGFGYFIMIFGIWDIFFYIWLKAALNWPQSFLTPDILFLIPLPWIGPVLAPVIISIAMILIGIDITRLFSKGYIVKPRLLHWVLVMLGSAALLYSFMNDTDAGFHEKYPQPYKWFLLVIGLIFFIAAYVHLHRKTLNTPNN